LLQECRQEDRSQEVMEAVLKLYKTDNFSFEHLLIVLYEAD
jgi:hypothetical protein